MLHTDVPPWRDLASGTNGDDAAALNAELRRLGGEAPDSDIVTWWTLVAFDRIAHEAGIEESDAAVKGSITRDMFVWLPTVADAINQCNTFVGQQVAQGDTLFTTTARVESAAPSTLPTDLTQGTRSIQVGSGQFEVNPDGTGFDSTDLLSAIQSSNEYLNADRQSGGTEGTGATTTTLSVSYTWKLQTPVEAFSIPPSAVYNQQSSSACVVSDGKPSQVNVIASRLGFAIVTTEAKLGRVAVAPEEPKPCQ